MPRFGKTQEELEAQLADVDARADELRDAILAVEGAIHPVDAVRKLSAQVATNRVAKAYDRLIQADADLEIAYNQHLAIRANIVARIEAAKASASNRS